ncbi:PREDICTED: uncharacterized protein LOC108616980 [Drosophila arizonae]|uniref:Uncharacterized protein LOC108616980 n=1 Tax=Drosophila arizonae TaxID=7263 RepID=A0ABM1PLH7_DROAR|nr:PREDICTED: uncharacterized protein LOC108616980 [Drosophila arizonae]
MARAGEAHKYFVLIVCGLEVSANVFVIVMVCMAQATSRERCGMTELDRGAVPVTGFSCQPWSSPGRQNCMRGNRSINCVKTPHRSQIAAMAMSEDNQLGP